MTGLSHKRYAITLTSCASAFVIADNLSFVPTINNQLIIPILWLPLSIYGGYIADVDKPGTSASNIFRPIIYIFTFLLSIALIASIYFAKMEFLVSNLFALVGALIIITTIGNMQHRKETHSIFFILFHLYVFYGIATLLDSNKGILYSIILNIGIGSCIGILSHIIIDMFNTRKMNILFPLDVILETILKKLIKKIKKKFKIKGKIKLDLRFPVFGWIITASPKEEPFIKKLIIFTILITAVTIILKKIGGVI